MATFWEIVACSVSNLFPLYFVYLLYLFISRFGFKSGICLLIAPVPVHCFSITFCENSAPSVKHNYIRFVSCIFVILVISHFGCEDRIFVLIVSVPGHCLLFYF